MDYGLLVNTSSDTNFASRFHILCQMLNFHIPPASTKIRGTATVAIDSAELKADLVDRLLKSRQLRKNVNVSTRIFLPTRAMFAEPQDF